MCIYIYIYEYIYIYIFKQKSNQILHFISLQAVSNGEPLSSGVIVQLVKKTTKYMVQSTGLKLDFHFSNS